MTPTPRFTYVVENFKKMIAENDTPHLTPNPTATPTSDANPNSNQPKKPYNPDLVASYAKTRVAPTPNVQVANPNVAQVPTPGQGPTNANVAVDPTAPVTPTQTPEDAKKALYDHLVNDLGLTDEMIADIYKK